ncbi:MAG: OmpA family protein [Phycisphaeraceae bacterium]|nr:OmpA family protein [Phycisphaeraceae bacterium]MCW5755147.1 OmpA family protein [Phycisphaeraceae bacterium]
MSTRRKRNEPGIPEWVLTYGDLMSLLLCFFILLAAFSEIKKPREYAAAAASMRHAVQSTGGRGLILGGQTHRARPESRRTQTGSGDRIARSDLDQSPMTGPEATVRKVHEGKLFVIGGSVGFEAADWSLSEDAKANLREIAERIKQAEFKVLIRGHAWGVEDRSGGLDYVEVSFRRAREVMDFLVRECGVRSELLMPVAVGIAEPQVAQRVGTEGVGVNRRVEVLLTEVALGELHPDPNWQGR